jgi:hypothetical protein
VVNKDCAVSGGAWTSVMPSGRMLSSWGAVVAELLSSRCSYRRHYPHNRCGDVVVRPRHFEWHPRRRLQRTVAQMSQTPEAHSFQPSELMVS